MVFHESLRDLLRVKRIAFGYVYAYLVPGLPVDAKPLHPTIIRAILQV